MKKIQAIGNVTKDAAVRSFEGGKNAVNFDIAVNERWKDKSGAKHEKVTYIKCVMWCKVTTIAQYIKKGMKVFVEGSPETEAYIGGTENKPISNLKIVVKDIEFLSSTNRSSGAPEDESRHSPSNDTLVPTPDDDLPF
jgi:single-strand DNA-binding protein